MRELAGKPCVDNELKEARGIGQSAGVVGHLW